MGNIILQELEYDMAVGHDVLKPHELDFDPQKYSSKEAAANALAVALRKFAVQTLGYTEKLAASEIVCWPPERTINYTGHKQWSVVWEGGPYEWAIPVSMQMQGPWGYCEPYYSFDLHFTD